jgi:hypothetical protein
MARIFRSYAVSAALVLATSLCVAGGARAGDDLTLKERLSDKASDEQRIDNCRVPMERRGTRPRPGCADATVAPKTSASPEREVTTK